MLSSKHKVVLKHNIVSSLSISFKLSQGKMVASDVGTGQSTEDLAAMYEADKIHALAWVVAYFGVKLALFAKYKGRCWDMCSLVHNVISVALGAYFAYKWDRPYADSCHTLIDHYAVVILVQMIHSVSDFVIFWKEMMNQPVFIYHHVILVIVSLILPFCPGCYYTVIAFTLAELGSLSIAVDGEWRKIGGYSRGLKRVVIFGATRLINLYLLYQIWLVTPGKTYFTLSNDGKEIFTVNVPVCMVTSVGGSLMMLCVNGVTWFRMFKSYRKFKVKRKLFKSKSMDNLLYKTKKHEKTL